MRLFNIFALILISLVATQPVFAVSKTQAPALATAQSTPVDINSATLRDLAALNGIGPAEAVKIEAGRPYASVDELASRGIISATAYDAIKDHVTALPIQAPPPGAAKHQK